MKSPYTIELVMRGAAAWQDYYRVVGPGIDPQDTWHHGSKEFVEREVELFSRIWDLARESER